MKAASLPPNLNQNSCPNLAFVRPPLMSIEVTLLSHGALRTSSLYQQW